MTVSIGCKEKEKLKRIDFQIINPIRNDTLTIQNYYTTEDSLLYQIALNDTFYSNFSTIPSDNKLSTDILAAYIDEFRDTFDRRPVYPKIIRRDQQIEFILKLPKKLSPIQYFTVDSSNSLCILYWYYQQTPNGELLITCNVNHYGDHTYELIQQNETSYKKIGSIINLLRWQSEDSIIYYPEFDVFLSKHQYWGSGLGGNTGFLYRIQNGQLMKISDELPIDGGQNFPFDEINYAWIQYDSKLVQNEKKEFFIEIIINLELTDTYTDSPPVLILHNYKKQIPLINKNGLLHIENGESLYMPEGMILLFNKELLKVKKYGNMQQRQLLRSYN
ncbi:MAG: hypothetical protein ACK5Z2_13210 [Bacteroidota bacterium]